MMDTLAEPTSALAAPLIRSSRPSPIPGRTPGASSNNQDAVIHHDPVAARVLEAISHQSVPRRIRERRTERRFPYPHPVYLTPLTAEGPQVDETVQVIGKHLSAHGLDFYHREPLPYRRMIASLEVNGRWVGLVLDLKWCRFTAHGLYENGGRFVTMAPSPFASDETIPTVDSI